MKTCPECGQEPAVLGGRSKSSRCKLFSLRSGMGFGVTWEGRG